MGSRVWLRVKTLTYVKAKELAIIPRMAVGKILVPPQGGFAALMLNAKKPLPRGLRGTDSMHQPLEIRDSSKGVSRTGYPSSPTLR